MIRKTPQAILAFLAIIVLSGAFSIVGSIKAQNKKEAEKEVYTRPKPTQPTTPVIPGVNKYQDDKVFLENADSLFRPGHEYEEKQVVKGNVVFRQGGMWMYCDSAYYFPERNSLDAYGHVRMEQGDTLFVYSDKLFYDGASRHAVLTDGPSQPNVIMKDPQVTLTTDSLDYDMIEDLGWYAVGGTLDDGVNVLTSVYGQYSPTTKIADFRDNVVLVNNDDGYKMYTEELHYDTRTNIADINTATRIEGENDTILTTSGWYDTRSDNAHLTSRSTILHRDSADNVVTLEGDSIVYDKLRHVSEAFMFTDPDKNPRAMILTDTARKMTLIGGYGRYNDSLQASMATIYPLLMEYSRPDTLFLRSDTIETYMKMEMVWPDSLKHNWNAATRARLRAFTSALEIADSMPLKFMTLPKGFYEPGMVPPLLEHPYIKIYIRKPSKTDDYETGGAPEEAACDEPESEVPSKPGFPGLDKIANATAVLGKKSVSNESPPDEEKVELIEADEKIVVNDIPEETETPPEDETANQEAVTTESVISVSDSVVAVSDSVDVVSDSVEIEKPILPRLDALGRDSNLMVEREFNAAKAIGKARFFNKDIQGIADTIVYHQYDSILHLLRKPIVWSGERQVSGDTIRVHFRDSVADWAYLPVGGIVIEHVDEEFYNQLSGSEMTAYFKNNELERLFVSGNVETIMLPMENDSTYANVVYTQGSYLNVLMDGKNLKRLTMWPDVEGTVTPIFLVKRNEEKYLLSFKWLDMLRPRRKWYGNRLVWDDDLGEVPDELEQYFNQ